MSTQEITVTTVEQTITVDGTEQVVEIVQVDQIVDVVPSGPTGPPGPAGPSGDDGYEHVQGAASATWTMNHNLGRRPVVDLFTTGGVAMLGEVVHTSVNQAVAYFATPIAGTARLV